MSYTYEAGNVDVNWSGIDLSTGWGEDTFLTITPNSDRVEATAGAGGERTYSKIADKSATIEMTFTQTADVIKEIGGVAGIQDLIGADLEFAPFKVVDGTGKSVNFVCENAVLMSVSEVTFGRAAGERTFTWDCEFYIMSDDPATITNAFDQYQKRLI